LPQLSCGSIHLHLQTRLVVSFVHHLLTELRFHDNVEEQEPVLKKHQQLSRVSAYEVAKSIVAKLAEVSQLGAVLRPDLNVLRRALGSVRSTLSQTSRRTGCTTSKTRISI